MARDVKAFGAKGDGLALDSGAIQAALDAAAVAGGTVVVGPGHYRCGTLHLRGQVELHLQAGAVLHAVDDAALFPEIAKTPYGNLPGQIQALLWADGVDRVAVTGQGIIDGGGVEAIQGDVAAAVKFRPALVFCRGCRDVKFLDVTLRHSSFWTLHLMRCVDVQVRGVTIDAVRGRINTDGIDPDGCRNVVISDCNINGGDDCIVIKSTEGDVCENIVVSNCVLSTRCAAIKIGTEAVGDIRNVAVSNCVVRDTDVGLALYMKDGSTYENMVFSNLVMEVGNAFPLLVDVTPRYYREPKIGRIRNIVMQNLMIRGAGRGYVEGVAGVPIENLTLRDIMWDVTGPLDLSAGKPWGARRVDMDPGMANHAAVPYQFVVRHVRGLRASGIQIADCRGGAGGAFDRGYLHGTGLEDAVVEGVRGPGLAGALAGREVVVDGGG